MKPGKAKGAQTVSILYICISSLMLAFCKTEIQDNFFNLWAIKSKWRRSFMEMRKVSNYQWHSSLNPLKHGFRAMLQSVWKCNYWFYFYDNIMGQNFRNLVSEKVLENSLFNPLILCWARDERRPKRGVSGAQARRPPTELSWCLGPCKHGSSV